MKIFLISIIFSSPLLACDFHKDYSKIYSLSGVATQVFKELGLLSSPRVGAVSIFHPINQKDFKGKVLGGGQFISFAEMQTWNSGFVLFDESRELSKILSRKKNIKTFEVKTRGKMPLEVIESFLADTKHLYVGCDLSKLKKRFQSRLTLLESLIPKKMKLIIYLGELSKSKYPEVIMANDGVIKYLREEKIIETYPSDLAYPNWSSKIMNGLSKDFVRIGITDSGSKLTKSIDKISENNFNLTYPGAMIPGIGQVEALIYFFSGTNNLL